MPYPPGHRAEIRAQIVRSAQRLFNRHGFDGVSIDEVMGGARLTRGGFYSYFATKAELYAEAVALSIAETPWSRWDGVAVDFAARDAARQVVQAYLSREHFDDVEGSCPMVTLPGDVARSEPAVKRAFEQVFEAMAGLFEESLRRNRRADRRRALAIAAICVGGMVIARSVDDAALARAIRAASLHIALELGGWRDGPTRPSERPRRKKTPSSGRRA